MQKKKKKKEKYQRLDKVYEFGGTVSEDDKKPTRKKYNKIDLTYSTNHSFYRYHDAKKYESLSLGAKYYFLASFSNNLDKFSRPKPRKEKEKQEKQICI